MPSTSSLTSASVALLPLVRRSAADAASGPAPDSSSHRGDSGSQNMPAEAKGGQGASQQGGWSEWRAHDAHELGGVAAPVAARPPASGAPAARSTAGGRPGHTLTASRQPAPRIHSWLRSCSCAVVGGRRAAAGMGQRRGGRCGAGHSSTPASAAQRAPAHPARMPPTMKASLRLISRPRTRAGLDSAAAEAAETCSQHRRSLSSRHAGCSEACRMQQSPRTGHHQPRLQCRRAQRAWRTQFRPRTAAAPP